MTSIHSIALKVRGSLSNCWRWLPKAQRIGWGGGDFRQGLGCCHCAAPDLMRGCCWGITFSWARHAGLVTEPPTLAPR